VRFDDQGHLLVSPAEVQEGAISHPENLINRVLTPGTPLAIPTHEQHCRLLDYLAGELGVHPRIFFFKGSTKIGFSIKPEQEKVWMEFGPASDLDLAIVDHNFFQLIDGQVRQWERNPGNRKKMFRSPKLFDSYLDRVNQKGRFECHRFFDLPPIPLLGELNRSLDEAPVADCCGIRRSIRAFIFRDWWGVYQRYDHDLHELRRGLQDETDPFPRGGVKAKPYAEVPRDPRTRSRGRGPRPRDF